jgi:hypothetical protein
VSESEPLSDDTVEVPYEPPEARPEPRTRSVRRPAKGRQTTGPKKPARSRTKTKAPAGSRTEVIDAVRGVMQIPATGFVIAGQRTGSVPLVADGATILVHGPMLASAIEDVANHDPRAMAMLEKLIVFGPYSALATALVIMGAQFWRNHDESKAPILEGFGAIPPEAIITQASLDVPVPVSPNGQTSENVTSPEN